MKSSTKEVLDRHKAFWNMEDVNQPLLMTTISSARVQEEDPMELVLADGTLATEGLLLKPKMISPSKISPSQLMTFGKKVSVENEIERCEEHNSPCLIGSMFNPISAYQKIPWMEAITGCPIHISVKANTMWAESIKEDDLKEINVNEEWIEKLKSFTEYLVDKFLGSYMVSTTLMRGPIDILSAMMGKRDLVYNLYRRKDKTKKMICTLSNLFTAVAKAQLAIIPRFHGGYCNYYGLWAPGTNIRTQDDSCTILPPKLCKDFVLPYHEKIASQFEYSIMDIHSGSELHMLDMLLKADNIKAISISIDPYPFGFEIDELLSFFLKIQEVKPLLINVKLGENEFEKLSRTLSPRGLAIVASIESC
jgi:hypothetical protein